MMAAISVTRSDQEETLLAADLERLAAMEAMDLDRLAALFGDELVYIHSSGKVDTKTDYLAGLRSGHIRYTSVRRQEAAIWIVGDLATLHGKVDIEALIDGEPRSLHARSLATWVRREGAWGLIAIVMQRIEEDSAR